MRDEITEHAFDQHKLKLELKQNEGLSFTQCELLELICSFT